MFKRFFIFFVLSFLVISSFASAAEVPRTVTGEKLSPFQTFLKDYFGGGGDALAISSSSYPTTVNRGETVSVTLNVKYQHDSDKSKFDVSWVLPDNTGVYAGSWNWAVTANQGDWFSTSINGIKTSTIPDSFCGKTGKLLVRHFNFYDGSYHLETMSVAGTQGTYFNCGSNLCDEKPVGSSFCLYGNVWQEWQTTNCQKRNELVSYCSSGQTCMDGACKTNQPVCTAGNIESPYCQDGSVVQKYQNTDCTISVTNVQTCGSGCENAQCVTPSCGNGVVDSGEGCESCPSDVTCAVGQACISNACTTVGTETVCNNFLDDDGDGVVDCADSDCAGSAFCGGVVDSDGDGVVDSVDNCPDTPKGLTGFSVDERGCSFVQRYGWTPVWILLTIIIVAFGIFYYFKKVKKKKKGRR